MSQLKLTADGGGGTVAIKAPASTTGNAAFELTVPGTGNSTLATTATAGKILQVIQAVKTDTQSLSSSATPVDITGLSVTITPANASSKFYITGKIVMGEQYASQHILHINVNGSNVGQPAAVGSRVSGHSGIGYQTNNNEYGVSDCPIDFLVDASNANAHTIKLQFSQPDTIGNDTKIIWVNRSKTDPNAQGSGSRYISTLTVMEVAA